MKHTTQISLAVIALVATVGISAISIESAAACEGFGKGKHFAKGDRFHLVPPEMKSEFRGKFKDLSDEERAVLKEEMKAMKQAHHAQMEEFTGHTKEEMREFRKDGKTMGDILAEQGKTQEDAEAFLTEMANDRVDTIVERHDLSAEDEQTIRERIVEFVQHILNKWFG